MGGLSVVGHAILDVLQDKLQLSPAEAATIEEQVLQASPEYQKKTGNMHRFWQNSKDNALQTVLAVSLSTTTASFRGSAMKDITDRAQVTRARSGTSLHQTMTPRNFHLKLNQA